MLSKPSVANYTVHFDTDVTGTNNIQVANSPCELVGILASATGSALAIRIYDASSAAEAIPANVRGMIAANTGESTPFTPCQPMRFNKGIYIVFEQGGTPWGGECTLVINK